MARSYYGNKGYKGRSGKKSKYNDLQRFAYKMGQIERGRKNPDSLITESYNNGKTPREKKQKKSLF
ncbi:MAG: hypothetical protein IJX39_06075 [Clostridia bacterium]|nr:hypothetical protein [Clostridia bacterium]